MYKSENRGGVLFSLYINEHEIKKSLVVVVVVKSGGFLLKSIAKQIIFHFWIFILSLYQYLCEGNSFLL